MPDSEVLADRIFFFHNFTVSCLSLLASTVFGEKAAVNLVDYSLYVRVISPFLLSRSSLCLQVLTIWWLLYEFIHHGVGQTSQTCVFKSSNLGGFWPLFKYFFMPPSQSLIPLGFPQCTCWSNKWLRTGPSDFIHFSSVFFLFLWFHHFNCFYLQLILSFTCSNLMLKYLYWDFSFQYTIHLQNFSLVPFIIFNSIVHFYLYYHFVHFFPGFL